MENSSKSISENVELRIYILDDKYAEETGSDVDIDYRYEFQINKIKITTAIDIRKRQIREFINNEKESSLYLNEDRGAGIILFKREDHIEFDVFSDLFDVRFLLSKEKTYEILQKIIDTEHNVTTATRDLYY